MRASLLAAFLLVLGACTGCVGQAAVDASPPSQVDTVAYAIRHSVLLDPPGCTGVEVSDGIVVTAKHCLDDGDVVGNPFGEPSAAGKIAWISAGHDAAVIEYPRLRRETGMIAMRDYVIGEHVYIVGYPVQLRTGEQELTVTDGLMAGPTHDGDARTTAEAYFGNSGGGVWGADGALLGILVNINAAPGLPGAPMPYPAQTYMVPIKYVRPAL